MNVRFKITAIVCLLFAFAFAALAALSPVYTKTSVKAEDLPDYDGVSRVIVGKDGFLFSASTDKTDGYGDYTGRTYYTGQELENRAAALSDTAKELEEYGCRSLFVFIPSKMSVYEDNLPDNVRSKKAVSRRYGALVGAAAEKGLSVLDLSETFSALKDENLLFHTCADELNDVGGFYLYNAVCDKLGENMKKAVLEEYTVTYSEETAYPLTREYRNETGKTVPNKTYTFEEKNKTYEDAGLVFENTVSTTVPEENRENGYSYPLICVFDTGAAKSCRTFFSASSSLCVFRTNMNADRAVLQAAKPQIAVFLIYETEFYRMPEKEQGVPVETEISAKPVIKDSAWSDVNRYVIFGECEKNSTVTVYGGTEVCYAYTEDGDFCIEVTVENIQTELSLYAKTDGKSESEKTAVTAVFEGAGYKNVVIGLDGHLHYEETVPDYLGTNLYSQETLDGYIRYMQAKAERIHAVSPDTEIIYVIAPNHLTIYPETAPDRLKQQKVSDDSRLSQLLDAFKDIKYVKFIDLKTALLKAKETAPYRIYNKTDTHWNELGAYYAYTEIMGYISKKFPAAAPDSLDAFNVYTEDVAGGDMANFLGVNLNSVKEHGVYVRAKNGLKSGIVKDHSMNFANAWFSDMHEFVIDNGTLPTMIMYRDSFSTNLMSFLAEKFSYSRFHTMWDYPEELELYEQMKPDYIIIEYVERGLGALS